MCLLWVYAVIEHMVNSKWFQIQHIVNTKIFWTHSSTTLLGYWGRMCNKKPLGATAMQKNEKFPEVFWEIQLSHCFLKNLFCNRTTSIIWWSYMSGIVICTYKYGLPPNRQQIIIGTDNVKFTHDKAMIWNCFLHYWPFVKGIHWSPMDFL